jgi:hypothetical protein
MNMRTRKSLTTGLLGGALLLAALALPATAQGGDARWLPFVGCWAPLDAGDEAGLLCFRPVGQGVEMFNVVGGETVSSELLGADGAPRSVSADGCTGFESLRFSEDAFRLFTRSEFTCGDEVRRGSGVMAIVEVDRWIDVRSLQVEGQPVAWVQGYELADAEALAAEGVTDPADFDPNLVRATRMRAARAIEIADVEEAATQVDARAVEVWVAAQEDEFELDGGQLVRLVDAGVPESVIDVMVAVTYPERFVLSPEGDAAAAERPARDVYAAGYRPGFGAYLWDPYYRPLGFGYYSRAPFGYYGYGSYYGAYGGYSGGYYGYRPITVIVQPAQEADGRMVPGRGYTRGSSSTGSDQAAPRSSVGSSPRTGPSQSSRPSSGSGSSGRSSSGNDDSSGSGSGSSRRTAQPRN